MTDATLPIYHLLHEIDAQFDQLVATIERAAVLYESCHPPTWRFCRAPGDSSWLREALLDMWHQQGQDGRETRNYIAVIAANDELINEFHTINHAKSHISDLLTRIKQAEPNALNDVKSRLPRRHPSLNEVLRKSGFARLHLKQCWRHIPIAPAPVSRVRLAWYSSGRSIKRVSVQEAEHKLLQLDSDAPHVRIQLNKLAGIPSNEVLAQVQTQAPLMRANLFFVEPLADGHTRRAHNIAMPLIVPANEGRLPHLKAPSDTPPTTRTRAKRRDEKLEDEPFLPSLRIFRYR
ncbi:MULTISPECIES: DNA replication terminus site-binding protein [Vreelandella]|uniref:DNA replication terminus site-binding protein n=2 Tax=Vreelandella TaxID=3137766 RepID=A0A7C9NQ67_9GAMM|nr:MULTISPECIES: DNA replication terminus site-binding protein [Halomonas]NDL69472.1 DNA replication terminus site-binding protein [Halomonas alkaliphila]NYS43820.1 DNA replication terminus site-binding protein [Halomonas zhaodongensis]